MITVVNYGLGNVEAIINIYRRLNVAVRTAETPESLVSAEKIILPGVGAFDWAITRLERSGMRSVLQELVVEKAVPVLGICVGMQMLANRSEEGTLAGLGWIPGDVRRLDGDLFPGERRLPHMGWNDVTPRRVDSIFRGLERESRFYFLHSYYFAPSYTEDTLAETDYNGLFTSSVCRGNVYGVQFHPEKSHHWGIQLLKNFSEI